LTHSDRTVFLAGANQAWRNYGRDFDNNAPEEEDYCALKEDLEELSRTGGNNIRIWVFTDGYEIPEWS